MLLSDIHQFSFEHNIMRLNPKKCEEMLVNFMHNHNFALRSITITIIVIGCSFNLVI